MTPHLPPSPLRVSCYAAFQLRWLGTLPKPAYFVTRVFSAVFYIYIYIYISVCVNIYIYMCVCICVYMYTDLNG